MELSNICFLRRGFPWGGTFAPFSDGVGGRNFISLGTDRVGRTRTGGTSGTGGTGGTGGRTRHDCVVKDRVRV